MTKRVLGLLLRYGLGIGLLAWIIGSNWNATSPDGDPIGLSTALRTSFDVRPLIIAVLLCLISVFITFFRWFILLRAQQLAIPLIEALRLGMLGFYFNIFIPGAVGGDIVKFGILFRHQTRRSVVAATIVFDRIIGLCGVVWFTALTGAIFLLSGELEEFAESATAANILTSVIVGALILTVATILCWTLLGLLSHDRAMRWAGNLHAVPLIGPSLEEFLRAAWIYRRDGRAVGLVLFLTLLSRCGFILAFYFGASSIAPRDAIPPILLHFLIAPVGMTVQAGFPTPNGLGGAEFAFGELYRMTGYAFSFGVLAALVQRIIMWALGFVGYVVYCCTAPSGEAIQPNAAECWESDTQL